MAAPIEITSVSQWNTTLRAATASGSACVVDMYATWCGPCKAIAPAFDMLARDFPQAKFLRVDVDQQRPIAAKYQVSAMPTFLLIKAGKQVDMVRGADVNGLRKMVARHAGPNPPVPPLPEQAAKAKDTGNEHFNHGRFDEAVASYSEAIEHAPTSAQLYGNRAYARMKATPPQNGAAAEDAKKAVELDPQWGKGWIRLGDALAAARPDDKAAIREAYTKAVRTLEPGKMKTETEAKLESFK